ncbi:GNAT family N-acetyltransferase [uncultured Kordia sp.]|uniref:GNAT family N-acetyltransferase n=1 Tax=uncultured Kordia sp. TaxID=507699 RepID=UPI002619D7A2|nr:GNAT family N-acetyltransferase [uncultured Kordia sp.]
MKIELITKDNNLLEKGIAYFWKQWGNDSNFDFYRDCIENSVSDDNALPKFYVLLDHNEIVACYALLLNDIISRQDIFPWFACLFVDENYRNQGIAKKLMTHALSECKNKGFETVYLSTDLENFYEKNGWSYHANGYTIFGEEIKIYSISLTS